MIGTRTRWVLATTMGWQVACARPQAVVGSPEPSQSGTLACAPTAGTLGEGTHVTVIAGDHLLTLVATSGSRSGQRTTGTLHIALPSAGASFDSLMGTAKIALDAVGATAPGATGDIDVVATEWMMTSSGANAPQITVRFGQVRAPAGTRPIEGAYTALSVNAVATDGFSGTWRSGSGDPQAPEVTGFFCAKKA